MRNRLLRIQILVIAKEGAPICGAPHFFERKRRSFIYSTLREVSLFLLESVLTQSADGALEILGQVLKGGAGGNAVVGIADGGVVLVTAGTNVFHGMILLIDEFVHMLPFTAEFYSARAGMMDGIYRTRLGGL